MKKNNVEKDEIEKFNRKKEVIIEEKKDEQVVLLEEIRDLLQKQNSNQDETSNSI